MEQLDFAVDMDPDLDPRFFLDFWCNMKAYSIITVAWSVNQKLVFVRTTFSPVSPSTTVIKTQQIYSEKDVAV